MPKVVAKLKAEEKKKSSSASSQSAFQKEKQAYEQQKTLDIQAAKRAAENFTRASTNAKYNANLQAYMDRLNALKSYGYDVSKPVAQVQQEIKRIQPAVQAENPNPYTSWTPEQLRKGIADTSAQIEAERKRKRNNLILKDKLSKMQDAAYQVQLGALNSREQQLLISYGRQMRSVGNRQSAAQGAQLMGQNPFLAVQAAQDTQQSRADAAAVTKMLRSKGYSADEIKSFLDWSVRKEEERANKSMMNDVRNAGTAGKIAASIGSVPLNIAGGVVGYADAALQRATATKDPFTGQKRTVDYYSPGQTMANTATGIRSAVSEDMGKVGSFFYNTGMSIADFVAAGAAPGEHAASILLGGSAAQNAMQSAHQRGATDNQALAVGLLSGIAEATFEKLSIGNIKKIKRLAESGALGGWHLLAAIGTQAGTEASEEGLTTLANTVSDALIMRDKSELNTAIRAYMAQGMSEDEATKQAWKDWGSGILQDVLGGALSGGFIGSIGGGVASITGASAQLRQQAQLDQRLQRADAFNQAQRSMFAGNIMQTGTADAEAARVLNRNSGTHGARDKASVRAAAQDRYGAQAKAVESVFEAGTADGVTFLRQFETAYDLGKSGATLETAMNTTATAGLNELQRENAWAIGRDAGIREGTIKEEANANGEAVRVRGSGERDDGQSAARQVQQVEGNAGSYQEGRSLGVGRNAKDSAAADLRYSEEVKSAKDLGIENGAVIKNLRTVDESSYTPDMQQYAQEMAATGHKVTFVSGLIHAQDGPGGMITRARGMVSSNGDVIIQADNERFTAIQIGRHEDGHLRIARGEIDLAATKDAVRKSMEPEQFDRAMQDYAEAYAGLDMTPDEIWEEIVCDAQGEMNIFEGTLMQNAEERASDLIRTVKAKTTVGEQTQERAPPGEKSARKFSYAGIYAKNADISQLDDAKRMIADGVDAETVRQETGWFRGMDGKWRFEISDEMMSIKPKRDLSNFYRLGDLIEHKPLFENYPDLENLFVTFVRMDDGQFGSYNRLFDSIDLNYKIKNDPDKIADSLAHEIQHAIQARERFASGASAETWERAILRGFDNRTRAAKQRNADLNQEVREFADNNPDMAEDLAMLFATLPTVERGKFDFENWVQLEEDPQEWIDFDAWCDELVKKYGDKFWDGFKLYSAFVRSERNPQTRNAMELYYNTAGEIEARDTAKRRKYTDAERKETPPDLGDEDTVFSEQKFSRELETDYEQALKNKDDDWAKSIVRKAAEEWGAVKGKDGKALPLYHGTHNFGFTEFNMHRGTRSDGLIYASTKREVSANYAGPNHYASVRQIGKGFAYATKSVSKIIDNASAFYGTRYKRASKQQLDNFRTKTEQAAQKLNDRYNDLYEMFRDMAKWESEDMEFSNAIDRIGGILSFTADREGWDDQTYVNETSYERKRVALDVHNVRRYMEAHREEIIENGWKDAMDLFSGHKLFDTIVDITHGYTNILEGRPQITTSDKPNLDTFSLNDAYSLQERLDEQWDIGSYELYGNVGDNPYIIDAKESDWTSVKAPDIMGDDKFHDTDEIAKKAKELGYTACIVKNVYDGGDKADDYIFFSENQVKSADAVTYDDKGKPISLGERFSDKKDLRYSRELDADYLAAVDAGNMDKAQRMVDDAAKAAGYNMRGIHVSGADDITVFQSGNSAGLIYFADTESNARKGARAAKYRYDAYLKVVNPVNTREKPVNWYDAEDSVRAAEWKRQGHDAVYVRDEAGVSLAVFNPEQIKSADPIVYDDDGNIIPLSERFNPEQADIRYSRETDLDRLARENSALRREAAELRDEVKQWKKEAGAAQRAAAKSEKDAAKWKRETTLTEGIRLRESDLQKAAKALLQSMQSEADAADLAGDLKALGEYILNGDEDGAMRWGIAEEMAADAAAKIVKNAVNTQESDPEYLSYILTHTKGKRVHVDKKLGTDIAYEMGCENITEFNRKYGRWLRLTYKESAADIEQIYQQTIDGDALTQDQMVREIIDTISALQPQVEYAFRQYDADYDAAVSETAMQVLDAVMDESIRQMPPTFADKALAKREAAVQKAVEQERAKADARLEKVKASGEARLQKQASRFEERLRRVKEQGERDVERAKYEYAFRANAAMRRMIERHEKQVADLKEKHLQKERNAKERRDVTAIWHKINRLGANFRQMVEHPAQAVTKHAPRELAKALQGVADVFYTENRKRSNMTVNAAIQNLIVQFDALKDTDQGIYYDPMLAELNRAAEKNLLNIPANQMTSEQVNAVYKLLKAHMQNITNANKFVTGKWAKGIWETGRDWSREVDGASPVMKGWTGDFLNWQLRPDSFFKRISGFVKDSVGERVQKMFSDGTEKMLRIQQDAYYTFREFTESKEFDKLSKRWKKDLVDVGLKDGDGKPVLLTRDMMLAVYMNLRNEQNLQAATYGGIEVPNFDEYYTGKTSTSYRHRTTTANVGGSTLELQNEQRDLQKALREGELTGEAVQEARARIEEIEDEIQKRAEEITGQMLKVRSNIAGMLTDYEKEFVETAAAWMKKSADYLNAETTAMYGIEKAQVPNYWPLHRDLSFVNTDMRTITDEINLENVGFLKERVQSRSPIMLAGFTFELENHTKKVSQYCGFAAVQRDFNKLYNTKLTREGSSLERKIRDKFGDEQRKLGASAQQYIDAYIAAVSGADKSDATVLSVIRRNLPRATLSLNLRVAVSQLASMPTAAAEIGWGNMIKGLPRGLKTAFSAKAKNELARKNPWFWQRYRGEGGMREFADMHEAQNWFDRFYNKAASLPVMRNLLNWCQDFDVFATASMWAMSEEWVKSNTDLAPGTEEFERAVGEKYADVIRKTQPNYTVTERSGLLRDKREGYKFLTMYKTQSNQNLNVLYDANATLMKYKRDFKNGANGVTKADVKAAERQFARSYTAVILGGSVTFAVLRACANAILHAMNSYRDDDDELSTESVLTGILKETIGAISGMFAFGSEIEELIMARITGDKYWGLSDSAMSAVSDIAERGYKLTQGDASAEDWEKFIKSMMNVLGVPYGNAKTVVSGFVNHIKDAQNGEFLSFEAGVHRTASQETNRILNGYLTGAGDKVKRAWDELLELKGGDESKAQEAMRDAIKEAYMGGKITDKQALDMLKRYGGKDGDDGKEYLLKWQSIQDIGVEPSKIDDAYRDGEISKKQALSALVKYKQMTQEDAQLALDKVDFAEKYGFEYSEKGVQQAVVDGEITPDEAMKLWKKFGNQKDSHYEGLLTQIEYMKKYPGVDPDLIGTQSSKDYEDYGKAAHIPAEDFFRYWQDIHDLQGNDKRSQGIAYIDALEISNDKKIALFCSFWAQSSLKYCPASWFN